MKGTASENFTNSNLVSWFLTMEVLWAVLTQRPTHMKTVLLASTEIPDRDLFLSYSLLKAKAVPIGDTDLRVITEKILISFE